MPHASPQRCPPNRCKATTLGKFASRSKFAYVTLVKNGLFGYHTGDYRQQAKWSLINISRDDPKFMLECLDDTDSQVRKGALIVFYELARGVPDAIPKLRRLAASDPDADVRSRAADVLQLQLQ
jgi:HEAT repeats